MEFNKNKQYKKVLVNLSDIDKNIIMRCFRNDGKIRSPTKTKLYNYISGFKPELTYNEIRYIVQYIDPEYQCDVEERLKNGIWNRDLKSYFNITDDNITKFSSSSFIKQFNQKEKRTLGQKKIIENQQKIQEQLGNIISQNEAVKYLIPPPSNITNDIKKTNGNSNIKYNCNNNRQINTNSNFSINDLDDLVYNDTIMNYNSFINENSNINSFLI